MIIIWVSDQAWGQDGWISAKLWFFCVFIDRCGVEVHELTRKERSRYPATLNEHTWSIKISYMVFRNFSCGTERVVPRNEVITEQGTARGKVFRLRFFVYRPEALRRPWKITKNQIFFHPAPPYLRHLFWAWRCCNNTWNCLCEWSVLRANELLTCAGQDGFFRTRWRHPV